MNTDIGYLQIAVRSAGGALPVADATVTVRSTEENPDAYFRIFTTDRSGQTPRIALPAPPRALSQAPEPAQIVPYATYIIETKKDGYRSVTNTFVPIYADVTSIQPVDLVPLSYPQTDGDATTRFDESLPPDL